MSNILVDRLENLKQATIITDAENIDFEDDLSCYDTLLDKVFNGSYDDVFLTNKLEGLSEEERDKAFETARKYKSLCFFGGEFSYWLDSIEGVSLSDYDLVSMKLLDNYDFILGLSIEDEDVLKELVKLQKTKTFEQKVIIDYLRGVFENDDVLKNTIKEMSNLNDFTEEQKAILCLYPEGVIYRKNSDNEISMIPINEIFSKIKMNLLGEDSDSFKIDESLRKINNDVFESIIGNIYDEYKNDIVRK